MASLVDCVESIPAQLGVAYEEGGVVEENERGIAALGDRHFNHGFPGFPNDVHRKARRLELAFVQHTNNSPLFDLIIRTISILLKEERFQFIHRRKKCQLSSRQQVLKTGMQCDRFPIKKNVNQSPRSEF
jgi:hypothetical protein